MDFDCKLTSAISLEKPFAVCSMCLKNLLYGMNLEMKLKVLWLLLVCFVLKMHSLAMFGSGPVFILVFVIQFVCIVVVVGVAVVVVVVVDVVVVVI